MSFTEIPIVDLSLADSSSASDLVLAELRHALLHIGFLYIRNHGVSSSTVSAVEAALPTLFALSDAAKAEVALDKSPHFLGYSGNGSEMTAGAKDSREQFEYGTELSATWTEGAPLYERLRGPNQWPSSFPELRAIVESYMAEMTALGERFLRLVAQALHLPPDTLIPFLSDQHRLKLVHYPAQGTAHSQGVGPHKDSSGWWTFLLQASPPEVKGLQVLNKQGQWIDVPSIPGTFVVNIGQAFEVVTNGVCKATTHRVVSGPKSRFSVPFFQGVRRDLTKEEALGTLKNHFDTDEFQRFGEGESQKGREIDSAFLKGKYDTWGESQLRTKVRSHRDVGKKFYAEVFLEYTNDDRSASDNVY